MSFIEVSDLRIRYGTQTALDGVSFRVEAGERLCLLGPSGCGKTTTLLTIAGFVVPDGGTVRIDGRDVLHEPPERRNIGVMFQNYALFPHLSIYDNVAFGLKMRKRPEAEIRNKVGQALDLVHLSHAAMKRPQMLSGGEQQRVAFARAIVIQPSLLLLDEPFSNLDARLRQEMRSELLALLQQLKIATVMVTHDQEEAMAIADRIAVMNQGRVAQVGTADEIYNAPASLFVARFVGESNVLSGRVEATGDIVAVQAEGAGRVLARSSGSVVAGQPVEIVLRPQNLSLTAPDAAPGPDTRLNSLVGRVQQVLFLGHRTEYRIECGGQTLLIWQDRPMEAPLQSGDPVAVTWRVQDTLVLPATPKP
jgi:spermidine/putrescine ABC transporter ATP-binding subunit